MAGIVWLDENGSYGVSVLGKIDDYGSRDGLIYDLIDNQLGSDLFDNGYDNRLYRDFSYETPEWSILNPDIASERDYRDFTRRLIDQQSWIRHSIDRGRSLFIVIQED